MSKIRIQRWCGALALGAGSLMAFGAHAAGTGSGQSQYQMDVQRCNSGDTSQDRATCLREAGAARQESQRNRLDDKQEGRYQDNAMMRCKNLPASQQQDCITQMTSGNTTTRGSVGGGGVLRETVIQVPAGTGSQSCCESSGSTWSFQSDAVSTPMLSIKPVVLSEASVSSKSKTRAMTSDMDKGLKGSDSRHFA